MIPSPPCRTGHAEMRELSFHDKPGDKTYAALVEMLSQYFKPKLS